MNHSVRPSRNNRPLAREEEKNATISIWWDIDSCQIPANCHPYSIVNNFMQALCQANFNGKLSISLYGDFLQINPEVEAQLDNSGLTLCHVPRDGGNDPASRTLIIHMCSWARNNPPPANILLISGDVEMWHLLSRLKESGYNAMLAHQSTTPTMNPPTDIIWQLMSLLSGGPPEPIQS